MSIPGSANPLLLASAATTGGYQISRSLRFNSADSAYLSRTPSTAGNRKTWTWAGWVKRSALGSGYITLFSNLNASNTSGLHFAFNGHFLRAYDFGAGAELNIITTAVFRDVAAWYHVVLVFDSTQAITANRAKLYVNGIEQSLASPIYPSLNADGLCNTAQLHAIGRQGNNNFNYFDGYLADIHFIDGQALTPSSFGQFDTNGVWQPKAYTGTYGTNGFHLDFADNSAATAATLGKDTSGNGNNFTPNNLSVTAGAGNDSLVDSPTNYGTDTGSGGSVRGNYATFNPLDKGSSHDLSNGNLDLSTSSGGDENLPSNIAVDAGKWYVELTITSLGTSTQYAIGFGKELARTNIVGTTATSWVYTSLGALRNNNSTYSTGATYTTGDVVAAAYDGNAGTLDFYKNGVKQGSTATGLTSGPYFFYFGTYATCSRTVNFGQRPFAYTAPSGFKALCTANLPTPTIANGATAMDVKLYTGNGSTQTISGLNFSPDLVWIKGRSGATDHALYDVVRGTQTRLESNTTDAEATSDSGLTAFNSDGFALSTLAQVNTNSATYAGWCWDAGSSTVTNTQGSITSQVRANASAGFSIATYTGTGATGSVGHGLGVTPGMIIVKARTTTTNNDWMVYHSGLANPPQDALRLNKTSTPYTNNTYPWNSSVTSTVFGVSPNSTFGISSSSITYVAYCFAPVAGYSSFNRYTGNGSEDGPFVFLGFRPALVMVRMFSSTGNWTILDDKREGYNVDNDPLFPNLSSAEGTTDLIDITSNGFKVRTTDATFNTNTGTYIYAAWASSPFAYSRAR